MSRVLDSRVDEERKGAFEIGVLENHLRRFSAQFQRYRNGVAACRRLHQRADLRGAGEREMMDARMRGQRGARVFAQACDEIERAVRQSRLLGDAREGEGREAGFLRRLQHRGIARRQRANHGAADDLHRIIPRHDMAGDAMRFAQGVDGVVREIGNGLAMQLVRRTGIEFQIARQRHGIGARLLQRLADIARFHVRERIHLFGNERTHLCEDAAALGGGCFAPCAAQRALRGVHGGVDVVCGAGGEGADGFAGRGIFNGDRRAGFRPAPADQ